MIRPKVKGFSVLETIAGMVIITVIFLLASRVFFNISDTSYSYAKFKAARRLDEMAIETKTNRSYVDETTQINGLFITKKVSPYQNMNNLLLLELEIKDATDRVLAQRKELILADEK